MNKLLELRSYEKSIAGYGASATTTTLIYHFGLSKIMEYIVDDNIAKQNTFSPGYHIPVFSPELIYEKKPDYILILAWRYADPIIKKHEAFLKRSGHFIVPLPSMKVI
jgi:ABC-type Fe3+-hydroxamate transport system substrate-binding protein